MDLEKLRYPIGRFKPVEGSPIELVKTCVRKIEQLPVQLSQAVVHLNDDQLNTPYRPDGWTVRQVVHHVTDSHINSYVRYHWALTEVDPIIKAYEEQQWAELPDGKNAPISLSLSLLEALHKRWAYLLNEMNPEDYDRLLNHPEWKFPLSLGFMTQLYAWHGEHHLAHIISLIKRKNWF